MHPTLFVVPLPAWAIPLSPVMWAVAALSAVLAIFGARKRARDLLVLFTVAALVAGACALALRGEALELSSLPVYSYGVLLSASLAVGWFWSLRLAARAGLARERMASCFVVSTLAAFAGARLLYALGDWQSFDSLADVLAFRRGGFAAYGGFLGGFAGSWLYLRGPRAGGERWAWADAATPSLALGLGLTRVGCYLFGCDFGRPLRDSAPAWLKALGTFPRWTEESALHGAGSPAWLQHVDTRGLTPEAESSLPVHPTQLYEALAGAALLALALWLRPRQRFSGQSFLAVVFGYAVLRFGIESLRGDLERGSVGPSVPVHWLVSVGLLVLVSLFLLGAARSFESARPRWVVAALGASAALAVFLWLRPSAGAPALARLSTSQAVALLTAAAAALAWHRRDRAGPRAPTAVQERGFIAPESCI